MGATPMLYTQLEYKMAAVMQGAPYRVVKTEKGLDVPWSAEFVLEGRILGRQREVEGPFGEFPDYDSGCHLYPVIQIDRVPHHKNPIYDAVYVGRPWTEIDCLQAMTTSVPLYSLYAWRSTEPDENRGPDKYPLPFRLKPGTLPDLPDLPMIPAIPPLRGK